MRKNVKNYYILNSIFGKDSYDDDDTKEIYKKRKRRTKDNE